MMGDGVTLPSYAAAMSTIRRSALPGHREPVTTGSPESATKIAGCLPVGDQPPAGGEREQQRVESGAGTDSRTTSTREPLLAAITRSVKPCTALSTAASAPSASAASRSRLNASLVAENRTSLRPVLHHLTDESAWSPRL
jgi:hypothetical protein